MHVHLSVTTLGSLLICLITALTTTANPTLPRHTVIAKTVPAEIELPAIETSILITRDIKNETQTSPSDTDTDTTEHPKHPRKSTNIQKRAHHEHETELFGRPITTPSPMDNFTQKMIIPKPAHEDSYEEHYRDRENEILKLVEIHGYGQAVDILAGRLAIQLKKEPTEEDRQHIRESVITAVTDYHLFSSLLDPSSTTMSELSEQPILEDTSSDPDENVESQVIATTTTTPLKITTTTPVKVTTTTPVKITTTTPLKITTTTPLKITTTTPLKITTTTPVKAKTTTPVKITTTTPHKITTTTPVKAKTTIPVKVTTTTPVKAKTTIPAKVTTATPVHKQQNATKNKDIGTTHRTPPGGVTTKPTPSHAPPIKTTHAPTQIPTPHPTTKGAPTLKTTPHPKTTTKAPILTTKPSKTTPTTTTHKPAAPTTKHVTTPITKAPITKKGPVTPKPIPTTKPTPSLQKPPATPVPIKTKPTTKAPPLPIKTTHAPVTIKTTHAPVTIKTTHAPVPIKTTHAPVPIKTTRAPVTIKTTHAPVTTKPKPTTKAPLTIKTKPTTHGPAAKAKLTTIITTTTRKTTPTPTPSTTPSVLKVDSPSPKILYPEPAQTGAPVLDEENSPHETPDLAYPNNTTDIGSPVWNEAPEAASTTVGTPTTPKTENTTASKCPTFDDFLSTAAKLWDNLLETTGFGKGFDLVVEAWVQSLKAVGACFLSIAADVYEYFSSLLKSESDSSGTKIGNVTSS